MDEVIVYDDGQFFVASDGTVFSSFDAFNRTELSTPLEDVEYKGAAWNGTNLVGQLAHNGDLHVKRFSIRSTCERFHTEIADLQ